MKPVRMRTDARHASSRRIDPPAFSSRRTLLHAARTARHAYVCDDQAPLLELAGLRCAVTALSAAALPGSLYNSVKMIGRITAGEHALAQRTCIRPVWVRDPLRTRFEPRSVVTAEGAEHRGFFSTLCWRDSCGHLVHDTGR